MLETSRTNRERLQFPDAVSEPDFYSLLTGAVALLRRRKPIILRSVLIALAIGIGYLLAAPSVYTATGSIVVDPLVDAVSQSAAQRASSASQNDSAVDTQVEILRSDRTALAVIRTLELREEPQIGQAVTHLFGWAISALAGVFSESNRSPEDAEQKVLAQFRKRLSVRRVGISNVIEVSFSSNSPAQAARIANSIVNTYLDEQRNAKVQASRAAASWLKEQISELSRQTVSVEGILRDIQPGRGAPASAEQQQQLVEITKAREDARAKTAQVKAELDLELAKGSASADTQGRYDAARADETALQARLNKLLRDSLDASRERAVVGSVESDSLRSAYSGLLQRLMATRYEAFPSADARIVSVASIPTRRSSPRSPFILAGALAIGLVLGLGGAFIADRLDRTFRSGSQVERVLQLPVLGAVPRLPISPGARLHGAKPRGSAATATDNADRGLLHYAASAPFSSFVETLRNMKLEMGLLVPLPSKRVIGFTSALQGEGKTTMASNFAHLLANSGHRVALVEADLRNVPESRGVAPTPRPGLWDVLTGRCRLDKAISAQHEYGAHVISAGSRVRIPGATDLLASQEMHSIMSILKERYDVVVLDLPPLLRLVDLKAIAPLIDSFVLVIEWGRTTIDDVQSASETEALRYKWAGALLNKAEEADLRS